MGNICASLKYGQGSLAPEEHNDEGGAPRDTGKQSHVLVVCLDYPDDPDNRLSATDDGDNFLELVQASGVQDVTYLKNGQCTIPAVKQAIKEVGGRCKDGDYFIFFFGGHGEQVADQDNDEDDGFDEAFVLVDAKGEISDDALFRDDDFAACVSASVGKGARVLVLTDCCHSGSIADFDKPMWKDVKGVSMAGCKDQQESGDTGSGGVFTHSLLLGVSDFSSNPRTRKNDYSCAQVYNSMLNEQSKRALVKGQDITLHATSTCACPSNMAWPLLPLTPYEAPQHKKNLLRQAAVKSAKGLGVY